MIMALISLFFLLQTGNFTHLTRLFKHCFTYSRIYVRAGVRRRLVITREGLVLCTEEKKNV